MHGRQTSYTNRAFNSLQFGVFYGIFERTVDLLRFFCATKVVWTCIHAYGGEWVRVYARVWIGLKKIVDIQPAKSQNTPFLLYAMIDLNSVELLVILLNFWWGGGGGRVRARITPIFIRKNIDITNSKITEYPLL